jgi:hypothetical protein
MVLLSPPFSPVRLRTVLPSSRVTNSLLQDSLVAFHPLPQVLPSELLEMLELEPTHKLMPSSSEWSLFSFSLRLLDFTEWSLPLSWPPAEQLRCFAAGEANETMKVDQVLWHFWWRKHKNSIAVPFHEKIWHSLITAKQSDSLYFDQILMRQIKSLNRVEQISWNNHNWRIIARENRFTAYLKPLMMHWSAVLSSFNGSGDYDHTSIIQPQ